MKICSKCSEEKDLSEFGIKNKEKEQYQPYCKKCMREYGREHYKNNSVKYKARAKINRPTYIIRNKAFITDYLEKHPCVDCGEPDIEVLQFDHIEMLNKRGGRIANYLSSSTETLAKEIAKCEIRCANCHFRRTRQQMGWSVY
jgi:hypothetical protein